MRRARAGLLVCAAIVLVGIGSWILIEPARRETGIAERRQEPCAATTFCDSMPPPPVELRVADAPLPSNDPDVVLIRAAVPGTRQVRRYSRVFAFRPNRSGLVEDPSAGANVMPRRLYLLRAGSEEMLAMVHGSDIIVLRRGSALASRIVRTDADLTLSRLALLDPATQRGDTFQLMPVRGGPQRYDVLAPDSAEIHRQWLAARQSSGCGSGPLTAVPPEWERTFVAGCRRR